MSWGESPGPPPNAGPGLLHASEFLAVVKTEESRPPFLGIITTLPILLITFAVLLDLIPPPTIYVTVKVVFEGT